LALHGWRDRKRAGAMASLPLNIVVPCALVAPLLIWLWALTGYAPRLVESAVARVIRMLKCGNKKKFNFTQIEEHLYLGSLPRQKGHLEQLKEAGIKAVVTLNQQWELDVSMKELREAGLNGLRINVPDYSAPYQNQIRSGVEWMQKEVGEGNAVYVHCNGGKGRSAVVVICFLMVQHGMSSDTAFEYVRSKRKIAKMKLGRQGAFHKQWRAISNFECVLKKSTTNDAGRATKKIVPTMEEDEAEAAVEGGAAGGGESQQKAEELQEGGGGKVEQEKVVVAAEEQQVDNRQEKEEGKLKPAAVSEQEKVAVVVVAEEEQGGVASEQEPKAETEEQDAYVATTAPEEDAPAVAVPVVVEDEKAAAAEQEKRLPVQPVGCYHGAPTVLPPVKAPASSTPRT